MRKLTRRQSNQSKKSEIVNYYYQWQILKPSGKRKVKRIFTVSVTKRVESYTERYYTNGSSPWFCKMKIVTSCQ
jgi:hypothetical protein